MSWLQEAPGTIAREVEGTVVFVDISGFTKMSERLARKGKVGAEEVTDVLGSVFAKLLVVAYENGGSLVKFGGDALLLFFSEEDHEIRGARAAFGMRRELRSAGRIETWSPVFASIEVSHMWSGTARSSSSTRRTASKRPWPSWSMSDMRRSRSARSWESRSTMAI